MVYTSKHTFSPNASTAAIITHDSQLSYAELVEQSLAVKNNLMERGLNRGQRVSILAPNCPEYVILLHGLWQAGMVAVPLSSRWPVKMIEELLPEINSSILIELSIPKMKKELQGITTIDGDDLLIRGEKGIRDLQNIQIQFNSERDATILFTSGSSRKPKAAMHSFGNHFFSALGSAQNIPFQEGDSWLLSLPLYHIGGVAILFRALLCGAAVAISSLIQSLSESLKALQITHISIVPTQLKQLLQDPRNLPYLKKMKAILLGGGPISINLVERALKEKLALFCSYGSTEMSSQISCTGKNDSFSGLQTAGAVLPHRDLTLAEDSEILVRGDTLFRGYVEGETVKPARDSNGWFHTGDLGQMDDQGYLTVTGRQDNMFISGGENIQPEEIESVMMQIEGINEVMVVPVDHPDYGKRPVAFIKIQENKIQENKIQDTREQEDKKKKASSAGGRDKRKKKKLADDRVKAIREYLDIHLPKFMIPDHFFPWTEERYISEEMKPNRQLFQKIANSLMSEIQTPKF